MGRMSGFLVYGLDRSIPMFDSKAIRSGQDLVDIYYRGHRGISVRICRMVPIHRSYLTVRACPCPSSPPDRCVLEQPGWHMRWKIVDVADSTIGCIVQISRCDRIPVACCVLQGAQADALQVWSWGFHYSGMGGYM
jgi:hypothetical protein